MQLLSSWGVVGGREALVENCGLWVIEGIGGIEGKG